MDFVAEMMKGTYFTFCQMFKIAEGKEIVVIFKLQSISDYNWCTSVSISRGGGFGIDREAGLKSLKGKSMEEKIFRLEDWLSRFACRW